MGDKAKGNIFFGFAVLLLVIAITLQGTLQMVVGIIGGILAVVSLAFSTKAKIKAILAFFRGY